MSENTLSQLSQIVSIRVVETPGEETWAMPPTNDAAARSAARIRTLLEVRKTRVPDADEIAEIIRQENQLSKLDSSADVTELVAALRSLSSRHEWHPDMGQCVCAPHKHARAVLAKHRHGIDNATLKAMAARCTPPPESLDPQEERPW